MAKRSVSQYPDPPGRPNKKNLTVPRQTAPDTIDPRTPVRVLQTRAAALRKQLRAVETQIASIRKGTP